MPHHRRTILDEIIASRVNEIGSPAASVFEDQVQSVNQNQIPAVVVEPGEPETIEIRDLEGGPGMHAQVRTLSVFITLIARTRVEADAMSLETEQSMGNGLLSGVKDQMLVQTAFSASGEQSRLFAVQLQYAIEYEVLAQSPDSVLI